MKKLTSFLMLLAMFAGASWGQDTETIQVSTDVASPEHVYTMKNGNGYWMNSTTCPTSTAGNAAQFAFYSVEGTENAYKIYCVTSQKWVSYTKAGSYSNKTGFASLIDSRESAESWHYEIQDGKDALGNVYCFAPFNSTGVAAKYMNWLYGVGNENPLDGTSITVGLWEQNATADKGSCWIAQEVQDVITGLATTVASIRTGRIYTIQSSRKAITWNGSDANCVGAEQLDASNPNHQFVAIKTAGSSDRFYFFNVGAGKFMSKSGTNASLTDSCEVYWTVKASGDDAWPLMIDSEDGKHFNTNDANGIIIDGWSTADAGNKLQITGVGVAEAALLETIQKKIVAHVQQEYAAWEAALSVGSGFGQYAVNSEELAAAKAELQNAADEAAALAAKQRCMNAYTLNGPVAGKYYRIKNTAQSLYLGIDGYTFNMKHKAVTTATTCDNNPELIWLCEQDGNKLYMKNVYAGLYPQSIPSGSNNTAKVGTGKDKAFTCAVYANPTENEDTKWNIFFGGTQVNCEGGANYVGNVNYWYADNAHYYIYEVEESQDELASMCADWYKSNPYTEEVPVKIELAEGVDTIISPSEFGNPVDINSAIDKLSLSADDATQEKVHQLFQAIPYVTPYVNAVKSYGALLSIAYETKAEWATIILPVNWSKPAGWTLYSCEATEGNILTLAGAASGVKNTPFIINIDEAQQGKKYQFIGYSNGAATEKQTVGLLTGVLEDGAKVPVGSYILSKYNDKMGFYRVGEGTSYDAAKYKCYLTLPAAAAARYAALFFEGDTETGIDGIFGTEAKQGNGVVYNMSGQRMNKMQKGLNIVNGKIILK